MFKMVRLRHCTANVLIQRFQTWWDGHSYLEIKSAQFVWSQNWVMHAVLAGPPFSASIRSTAVNRHNKLHLPWPFLRKDGAYRQSKVYLTLVATSRVRPSGISVRFWPTRPYSAVLITIPPPSAHPQCALILFWDFGAIYKSLTYLLTYWRI